MIVIIAYNELKTVKLNISILNNNSIIFIFCQFVVHNLRYFVVVLNSHRTSYVKKESSARSPTKSQL